MLHVLAFAMYWQNPILKSKHDEYLAESIVYIKYLLITGAI
jgi:hypothetical protein